MSESFRNEQNSMYIGSFGEKFRNWMAIYEMYETFYA